MTTIAKRSFLAGLASLLGAPAIVHAGNIMPVKRPPLALPPYELQISDFILPYDVVLRLGGGNIADGQKLLDRWVAGVRAVIEAERRGQADLRAVLDEANSRRSADWGYGVIDGDVRLTADTVKSVKYWA